MSPRVLVLGGGGFIGRRIVARLLRDATARPVAAGRRAPRFESGPETDRSASQSVESLALDATDPQALRRAVAGVAAIVNCVTGDTRTIVEGARLLFETAAKCAQPPRIVDESTPLRGDLNEYGAAKVAAEEFASRYAEAVTLRPGIVYGPGSPLWSRYIAQLLVSGRLGDLGQAGQGTCNLVHVDDVAHAVAHSLGTPSAAGRAFNLSMSAPPSWNEYFSCYAQALHLAPVKRISAARLSWETKALAPLLKAAELASRGSPRVPPPIRPWLLELCRHRITLRVGAAEQALKLSWIPLQQGLAETAAWFLRGEQRGAAAGT